MMRMEIKKYPFIWARPLKPLVLSKVTGIALHHMAHPTAGLEEIHQWHLARGWKGFAYNYWIDYEGGIWEGRGLNSGGALLDPLNDTVISIGFQGDYDKALTMPRAQYEAGVWLINYLKSIIPTIKTVQGHKYWQATSCPGKYFPLDSMIKGADYMVELVKDFQRRYDLKVDGIIGPQTKGKAKEVKELIDYILAYEKPKNNYTYTEKSDGTKIIEVDPLSLRHVWLRGADSKPASELVKKYPNFINAMFFESQYQTVYRLLIQDGQVLSPIMDYDKNPDKGTFIVYKNGKVEVRTIGRDNFHTLDVPNIHMAIQGFNLDYEANGSTNLRDSMRKEGWGQSNDYIYNRVCNRGAIGYNYKTGKVVIVKKKTDAYGIRLAIREAGCKTINNDTCGIGLDSGDSDALVLDGKVILGTSRKQVSILTFD